MSRLRNAKCRSIAVRARSRAPSVWYSSAMTPVYLARRPLSVSWAPGTLPLCRYCEISTRVLVVPAMAESTTTLRPEAVMSEATSRMRAGVPTDVPPNFNTFIL